MMDSSKTDQKKVSVRDPVQDRAIRTKKKIIDAGAMLFSERGYHNVTADEIAHAAGVSVGTFYAYFMDKHDLFLANLDDYIKTCNRLVIEGIDTFVSTGKADAASFILKIINLEVIAHRAAAPLLNEFLKMSLEDSDVKRRFDAVGTRITTFIEGVLIQSGMDKERAAPAAFVIFHASEGIVHKIALNHEQIDEDAVFTETAHLFSAYIDKIK